MRATCLVNETAVDYLIENLAGGKALSLSVGQLQQVEADYIPFTAGGKIITR